MLRWLSAPASVRIEPGAAPGAPAWSGALAALGPRLAAAARRSARVRFVVSDHFVRYLALPWDPALTREDERSAYLRHGFESVYGPRAAGWSFTVDGDGDDGTRIGAAMDSALVAALREAAARSRLALRSIVPLAVEAFNRLRPPRREPPYFLVVREPGRLTALYVQGGAASRISSRRCAADPRRELAALLAAEAIDAGLARGMATRVYPACWEGEKPLLGAPLALESLLAQPERAEAAA